MPEKRPPRLQRHAKCFLSMVASKSHCCAVGRNPAHFTDAETKRWVFTWPCPQPHRSVPGAPPLAPLTGGRTRAPPALRLPAQPLSTAPGAHLLLPSPRLLNQRAGGEPSSRGKWRELVLARAPLGNTVKSGSHRVKTRWGGPGPSGQRGGLEPRPLPEANTT